jgi:predicted metal-dependent phosphoesterase TrpH
VSVGAGGSSSPVPRTVDLHMHSTASDGSRAPEDVAAAAHAAGLTAIALTDHDTVAGVDAARAAGARLGLRVITGVELSADDEGREIHILGLHLERLELIEVAMREFRSTRVDRARRMVDRLNALGVPVTFESVLAQAGDGAVGRPHVARAVVAGGWASEQREVFDRWLGNGRPANVPKQKLDVADAIRIIHEAGGLAIVAHPGVDCNRTRIERLVALGLDGLEVRHPSHSADEIRRLGALVEYFRLVPSGGSDWHGAPEGPRTIGCMQVPYEVLERQEARLAGRTTARSA